MSEHGKLKAVTAQSQRVTGTIALIVNHPIRDLEGICLLALELARQGHTAVLMPMYLNDEIFSIAPDYVLANYLRMPSQSFASTVLDLGMAFGFQDSEGGPSDDLKRYFKECTMSENIAERVADVFFWGENHFRYATELNFYPKEAMSVAGGLRFDLYSEPWRKAVLRYSADTFEYPENMILICSNFALTTNAYGDTQAVIKSLTETYMWDESMAREWISREKKAIVQMMEIVKVLSVRLPEANIIYRPHPFESCEGYLQAFSSLPNVQVVRKGSINGWMLRARAAVQLDCTTCYDAHFAGTPSFRPEWIDAGGIGEVNRVNIGVNEMDALVCNLEQCIKGEFCLPDDVTQKHRDLVAGWFRNEDGLVFRRIADAIGRHISPERVRIVREKTNTVARSKRYLSLRQPRTWLNWGLGKLLGLTPSWDFGNYRERDKMVKKNDSGEKFFSVADIRKLIDSFAWAAGISGEDFEIGQRGIFRHGSHKGRSIAVSLRDHKGASR